MRLVIQRVSEASVKIDGKICGSIGNGLLVFVGVHKDDIEENCEWLVNKLVNLRLFEDEHHKMNLGLKDIQGEVLIVSQFTLYANCSNGRRPDFFESAPPALAKRIYEKFVADVEKEIGKVQTGQFGAEMAVSLVNNGPVTIILDGKEKITPLK